MALSINIFCGNTYQDNFNLISKHLNAKSNLDFLINKMTGRISRSDPSQNTSECISLSISQRECRVIFNIPDYASLTGDAVITLGKTQVEFEKISQPPKEKYEACTQIPSKGVEGKDESKEEEKSLVSTTLKASLAKNGCSSSSSIGDDLENCSAGPEASSSVELTAERKIELLKCYRNFLGAYLPPDECDQVILYIKNNWELWRKKVESTQKNLYMRSSPDLPRALQYNVDHSLYMHFNRGKAKGDPLLGKGAFKEIRRTINLETGQERASAGLNLHSQSELEKMKLVAGLTGYMQILCSAEYLGKKGPKIRVTMQWCELGNLHELGPTLTFPQYGVVARQLLRSLALLHGCKLLHRDLKLANVVLSGPYQTCICDLNSVCSFDSPERAEQRTTHWYISPEYARAYLLDLKNKKVVFNKLLEIDIAPGLVAVTTDKLDVWSMGVMLYQLFFGDNPPWIDEEEESPSRPLVERIANLKEDWFNEPEKGRDAHLIWSMLQINPDARISAAEALAKIELLYKKPKPES